MRTVAVHINHDSEGSREYRLGDRCEQLSGFVTPSDTVELVLTRVRQLFETRLDGADATTAEIIAATTFHATSRRGLRVGDVIEVDGARWAVDIGDRFVRVPQYTAPDLQDTTRLVGSVSFTLQGRPAMASLVAFGDQLRSHFQIMSGLPDGDAVTWAVSCDRTGFMTATDFARPVAQVTRWDADAGINAVIDHIVTPSTVVPAAPDFQSWAAYVAMAAVGVAPSWWNGRA